MQVRYEKVGRTGKNRFTGEQREPIDKSYYICQTYNRLGKNACTSHKIEARDLYNLVLENVLNNFKSKTRNALIRWSDLQINKTAIKEMKDKENSDYRDFIKIRDKETGKFENIDFNKDYKILISDKYLSKHTENIKCPEKIRDNFETTNYTYDDLFMEYLKSIDFDVKMTTRARERRIL